MEATRGDARRATICDAAIKQFSEHGYRATSMARIAEAAGVSRPALYQYFSDKEDVFAAAFARVFEERVDAAVAAMTAAPSTHAAIDALLQRYDGDLWQMTSSSPNQDELMQAKSAKVAAAIGIEVNRLWDGVQTLLNELSPGTSRAERVRRAEWLEILRGSPRGLRFDEPNISTYRQRLSALARAVASDIDNGAR